MNPAKRVKRAKNTMVTVKNKGDEVEMTIKRIVELLEIEHECMLKKSHLDCDGECGSCKLVQDDGELHEMYTNAIAMLKAQQPRVMTLAEVKAAEVVWIEQFGVCVPAVKVRTLEDDKMQFLYTYERDPYLFSFVPKCYGKVARCWTSRPTDEQRKAVKWNGETEPC